ncbi:hypothetical protein HBA54_11415 [Pelagibius litoralis]|uniref:Uncharacterized protein n=1 Tax=Pelagibius litoralis TaxID=374515 RepID=A0A967EXF8_9PROT|nr:hypothetical protein [Pelagibius litoralis]NIA69198.1 hypothetical protein [Pelagibius litoralis]
MAGGGIDFEAEHWLARHWLRLRQRAGTFTEGQRMMLREGEEQLRGRALVLVFYLLFVALLTWL